MASNNQPQTSIGLGNDTQASSSQMASSVGLGNEASASTIPYNPWGRTTLEERREKFARPIRLLEPNHLNKSWEEQALTYRLYEEAAICFNPNEPMQELYLRCMAREAERQRTGCPDPALEWKKICDRQVIAAKANLAYRKQEAKARAERGEPPLESDKYLMLDDGAVVDEAKAEGFPKALLTRTMPPQWQQAIENAEKAQVGFKTRSKPLLPLKYEDTLSTKYLPAEPIYAPGYGPIEFYGSTNPYASVMRTMQNPEAAARVQKLLKAQGVALNPAVMSVLNPQPFRPAPASNADDKAMRDQLFGAALPFAQQRTPQALGDTPRQSQKSSMEAYLDNLRASNPSAVAASSGPAFEQAAAEPKLVDVDAPPAYFSPAHEVALACVKKVASSRSSEPSDPEKATQELAPLCKDCHPRAQFDDGDNHESSWGLIFARGFLSFVVGLLVITLAHFFIPFPKMMGWWYS